MILRIKLLDTKYSTKIFMNKLFSENILFKRVE